MRRARLAVGAAGLLLWLLPGLPLALLGFRALAVSVWCRIALWAIGANLEVKGRVPPGGALVAANHASYVDIFALGAAAPGVFVAKSEIARWPLIGLAATIAGMIFVTRDRARGAAKSILAVRSRLASGERVLLFPEGGIRSVAGEVTRFHSMFFDRAALGGSKVVPAAIRYLHPADPSAWLWIDGETPFGHLVNSLLPADPLKIAVVFGDELAPDDYGDRKALAEAARSAVEKLWNEAETQS